MSYSLLLPLLFVLFCIRRNRHEFAIAWQYRRIFQANIYWGIAIVVLF